MHSLQAFLVKAEKILSAANSVGSTLQLDTNQETELQGALTSLFEGLWRDTWANVTFETLSDHTNSHLEESAFRIALGLLKQETPEGIRKLALQLCACLTKTPDLAAQFLRDGCLKEIFKKTVYQTEAAVILRHLLEEDPRTLQTSMVLEIKQTFNEMDTLKDNDWNLSQNFLKKMAHVISRGPLLFLEAVAWTCVLETAWAEDEFYIHLSKSKMNNQIRFFIGECSGRRHETISSNFTTVLHDLADVLLSLFAEQKLEGATVVLNLLGGLCFIYIHSVGIIVHLDAEISTPTHSKGIFYSIIHSSLLLTSPTVGCEHELSEKGSSFLLAVCRLSSEGRTRVMEALSNVLSDFFKSSSASKNVALFPVGKFAHIAMFLEKVLLVRKEAADGGGNKTLLPDHDAYKMGRRLVKSLLEMVQLVDTKGSGDFQFSEHVLQSLNLLSKAFRESGVSTPSETILCDVDSINFEDGNQENLFSFRQPVTLKWEPIKDEVHVDTLSKLLETRMRNANEELLFIRKLQQKLGETSSSDLSAQPIIQDVKSSQRQEDEVDGQQHGIKKEHHQPLLSSDDLNIFLRCLLRAPVNISHLLDNDQELVKTHFLLSGLMEPNNEHFARILLDVLHAEVETSPNDQMVISWVLLLLRRLVIITNPILDVFFVRDLVLLLKLLNLQSDEEPLMLLVMYLLDSVVSRATRQVEDERSKCLLDELQPYDLQNLCIFFCKKGVTNNLFYLAQNVLQGLSRSHETRREFFVLRLSEIAGNLIKGASVDCWTVIDLLDLINLLIEKEDLVRLNLDLQSIWKLVCEYMGELGGQATSSHFHVISSFFRFCDITEEHHVHAEFAENYKIMLNQFMIDDIYLLDSSFSLLLKTPEFIDFANKTKYFMAKVFEDVPRYFEPPKLEIHVQRDQVFRQSYSLFENGQKLDLGSIIHVSFEGEDGVDFDGLTREWFRLLSKAIIVQRKKEDALQPENLLSKDKDEKEAELFSAAEYSVTYQPNPQSRVQPSYYTFIGRVVAFALSSNNTMDVTFTPSFYKHMIGADITYHDMETMDILIYNAWEDLLQNPAMIESVDLWFRDNNTTVTKENLQKYIDEEADYYMTRAIDDKRLAFLEGFHDLIPRNYVKIFNAEELRNAMSGMPTIEIEALKQTSTYVDYVEDDIVIQWFWEVLASFEHKDKALFLGFVTGTPRFPADGLKLIIARSGSPNQLPAGHTCAKQLDLPSYSSKEQLKEKLLCAIRECDSFGFV